MIVLCIIIIDFSQNVISVNSLTIKVMAISVRGILCLFLIFDLFENQLAEIVDF